MGSRAYMFSTEEFSRYEHNLSEHLATINLWLNILSKYADLRVVSVSAPGLTIDSARSKIILKELQSRSSGISQIAAISDRMNLTLRENLRKLQQPRTSQANEPAFAVSQQLQDLHIEGCDSQQNLH